MSRLDAPSNIRIATAALAAASVMLGLAVGVNPGLAVAGLIGLLIVGASFRDASFAAYAFVAAMLFQNIIHYTGTMLSPVKLTGALLVAMAIVVSVVRRVDPNRTRPVWSGQRMFLAGLVGILAWAMASVGWAVDISEVKQWSIALATVIAVVLSIGVVVQEAAQLQRLMTVLVVATSISTVWGLIDPSLAAFDRAAGALGDPNEYAAAGVVAIAAGYALYGINRRPAARVAIAICTLTTLYGVLQSQSRGGMVGLAVMGLVLVATARGRERRRIAGAGLVSVAMFIVFLISPGGQAFIERFQEEDSSGRTDLWTIAAAQFADHPVRGVGIGNYLPQARNYTNERVERVDLVNERPTRAHSFYLEWLAEMGVLGFSFVVALLWSVISMYRRAMKMAVGAPRRSLAARGLLAGTMGMLTCQVFISGQYLESLWVQFALAPVALAVCEAGRRSAAASADAQTPSSIAFAAPAGADDPASLGATFEEVPA